MAKLTEDVKSLIVTQLAQYRGYAEVARLVTEETGVTVDRFQVRTYDPTKAAYAGSEKWREIFNEVRSRYLSSIENIPIAHKAYRLNVLQQICDEARSRGHFALACATLEQAAREVSNSAAFEKNGSNRPNSSYIDLTPEERRAKVTEMLRDAIERKATEQHIEG